MPKTAAASRRVSPSFGRSRSCLSLWFFFGAFMSQLLIRSNDAGDPLQVKKIYARDCVNVVYKIFIC
jgi:hypothetical protein